MKQPPELSEDVFQHLFEITDKSRFTAKQRHSYEKSELEYNQMKNALDYAIVQGKKEGIEQGIQQGEANALVRTIEGMLAESIPWQTITRITGIAQSEFPALQRTASA